MKFITKILHAGLIHSPSLKNFNDDSITPAWDLKWFTSIVMLKNIGWAINWSSLQAAAQTAQLCKQCSLVKENFDSKIAPIRVGAAQMELDGMKERLGRGVKARLKAGKANTGKIATGIFV